MLNAALFHGPLAALILITSSAQGQTILLFHNDFSAPNSDPYPNCGPDLDADYVNMLWGGTGTGTGGGGAWAQTNTVETILINGPNGQYTDVSGIGGDYCLSMLSSVQNDNAALTLDCEQLPYVNLYMDISAVDLAGCGGPFGLALPTFHVMVFDSPGGVFDIYQPGTMLDEDTLAGIDPSADPYSFTWASVQTGLDVSGATDGNVTVMLDLLTSGYAAFDNVQIDASIWGAGIDDRTAHGNAVTPWPNPAEGRLWLPAATAATNWSILDRAGITLAQGSRIGPNGLDIAWLKAGLYVLRCEVEGDDLSVRFVKQ